MLRTHLSRGQECYKLIRQLMLNAACLFCGFIVFGTAKAEDYLFRGSVTSNVLFDVHSNVETRGFQLSSDDSVSVEVDVSYRGFSSGLFTELNGDSNLLRSGYFSFTFSPGFIDASVGINYLSLDVFRDRAEVFLELNKNYGEYSFIPGSTFLLFYTGFGIDGIDGNYSQVKLEQLIYLAGGSVYINPYFSVNAGEQFYSSWGVRSAEVGADITREFMRDWYASAYFKSLFAINSSAVSISGESTTISSFGVGLRYSY